MRIDRYYQDLYKDQKVQNYSIKAAKSMLGLVSSQINPNDNVLEAGSGDGAFAAIVSKESKASVVGMDLSESGLKKSRKIGVNVVKGDLQKKFPFKNEAFDVIFSGQVIEHLLDPDLFLDECYRVLTKNGKIILTTPNLTNWFNRIIFLFGYQPFFMESSTIDKTVGLSFTRRLTKERQVAGHIRVFTPGALKDLLKLHRFKPVEHRGYSGGYFPSWMQVFDSLFSHIPSLASNIYMVAMKK